MMDAKALRELSVDELAQKLHELRDDLLKLRLRAAVTQLENPSRLRQLRREIARGETVRRELLRKQPPAEADRAS
jgi:large subunit ribosomal protein L29